jgi:type IV pilus assembly protein PilM
MSIGNRSLIGVDIQSDSISVVELRGKWGEWDIVSGGSILLPVGAIERGFILDTTLVAQRLRDLLVRLRITSRDAVFGLPGLATQTRVMELPKLSHKELIPIVQSELSFELKQGEPVEAFDFIQLGDPEEEGEALPLPTLLVAAETKIAQDYMDVALRAGLNLIAIEPVALSMYRASCAILPTQDASIWLSVGNGDVEVAIMEQGMLRLYRRLDISGETLFNSVEDTALADDSEPEFDTTFDTGFHNAITGTSRRAAGFHALVMELQRSIEYFQRRRRDDPIKHIIVATSRVTLQSLAEMLSNRLGVPAQLVNLDSFPNASEALGIKSPEGLLRYVGAFGLAMYEHTPDPTAIPCFDLRVRVHEQRQLLATTKKALLSLVASIALMMVFVFVAFRVGMQANLMEHQVEHLKEDLKDLQIQKQQVIDRQAARQSLVDLIQTEGISFARVVDAVSNATSDSVGLTEINVQQTGHVNITGDASAEKGVIQALDGMKRCPLFLNVMLDSFNRQSTGGTQKLTSVRFLISADIGGVSEPLTKVASNP